MQLFELGKAYFQLMNQTNAMALVSGEGKSSEQEAVQYSGPACIHGPARVSMVKKDGPNKVGTYPALKSVNPTCNLFLYLFREGCSMHAMGQSLITVNSSHGKIRLLRHQGSLLQLDLDQELVALQFRQFKNSRNSVDQMGSDSTPAHI